MGIIITEVGAFTAVVARPNTRKNISLEYHALKLAIGSNLKMFALIQLLRLKRNDGWFISACNEGLSTITMMTMMIIILYCTMPRCRIIRLLKRIKDDLGKRFISVIILLPDPIPLIKYLGHLGRPDTAPSHLCRRDLQRRQCTCRQRLPTMSWTADDAASGWPDCILSGNCHPVNKQRWEAIW